MMHSQPNKGWATVLQKTETNRTTLSEEQQTLSTRFMTMTIICYKCQPSRGKLT